MSSILDEFELNKENFEGAIGVGTKLSDLCVLFQCSMKDLDNFVKREYNPNLTIKTVYEMVRQMVVVKYMEAVKFLGQDGNQSALKILDEVLRSAQQEQTVRIVFENNIPLENEEDKNDEQ